MNDDEDSQNCGHEKVECPQHEGNWDCNPFCRLCEGDQEYCPKCYGDADGDSLAVRTK